MPDNRQQQAVMFADVSGSSGLYKQLGNTLAKQTIDTTLNSLKKLTLRHKGAVVKTLGDEVMARFPSAEDACLAATAMQQATHQPDAVKELGIRIGIAFGETLIDEHGDVFGEVVNDAAAVAHIARANQIVITDALADHLGENLKLHCQAFDHVTLKGGASARTIYRLAWETPTLSFNATRVMSVHEFEDYLAEHSLFIATRQGEKRLTPEDMPYTIGRDQDQVKLHISSGRASREHCDIVFRRGKYVLVDHSTNGTYIHAEGAAQPLYIRREEAPLTGTGMIGIGQLPGADNPDSLRFRLSETCQQ